MKWHKFTDKFPCGSASNKYLCYSDRSPYHFYVKNDRKIYTRKDNFTALCKFVDYSEYGESSKMECGNDTYELDFFKWWIPVEEILKETLPKNP